MCVDKLFSKIVCMRFSGHFISILLGVGVGFFQDSTFVIVKIVEIVKMTYSICRT